MGATSKLGSQVSEAEAFQIILSRLRAACQHGYVVAVAGSPLLGASELAGFRMLSTLSRVWLA